MSQTETPTNRASALFAFRNIVVPGEPAGKYQTVANLLKVIGWVALIGGSLALVNRFIEVLFIGAAGLSSPLFFGDGMAGFMVLILLISVALVFGGCIFAMMSTGRVLALWANKEPEAIAEAKQFSIWLAVIGAVMLLFGGGLLLGGGLLGLAIALMILAGDDELNHVFPAAST